MKTDLYTKIVFTVIAVALVANFLKNNDVISSAYASSNNNMPILSSQKEIIDVNIVSVSKPVDVNLRQYAGTSLQQYERSNYKEAFESYGKNLLGIPMMPSNSSYSRDETKPLNVNLVQYAGKPLKMQSGEYSYSDLDYITVKAKKEE